MVDGYSPRRSFSGEWVNTSTSHFSHGRTNVFLFYVSSDLDTFILSSFYVLNPLDL